MAFQTMPGVPVNHGREIQQRKLSVDHQSGTGSTDSTPGNESGQKKSLLSLSVRDIVIAQRLERHAGRY